MFLGFIAGLMFGVGFVIGFKAKERYETTGTLTGRIKTQTPVYLTDEQARELEERIEAGA
jgi:transposase